MRIHWANVLTGARLFSTIPLVWSIYNDWWKVAFAIFIAAAFSDYFDGRLARSRGQVSRFGGIADHATDALFVTAACGVFAAKGVITPLLPVLILAAFLQYLLDSRALAGRHLRASYLGRLNGIAYFVVVGVLCGAPALGLWSWLHVPTIIFVWLLVLTTVMSMVSRAWALFRS